MAERGVPSLRHHDEVYRAITRADLQKYLKFIAVVAIYVAPFLFFSFPDEALIGLGALAVAVALGGALALANPPGAGRWRLAGALLLCVVGGVILTVLANFRTADGVFALSVMAVVWLAYVLTFSILALRYHSKHGAPMPHDKAA